MFLAPEIFSRIVFATFNDNCSAQDKCRVPKLVWLEPSDHENSEYVKKIFSSISVNRTVIQNVWRHHFLQPEALSEVGETMA